MPIGRAVLAAAAAMALVGCGRGTNYTATDRYEEGLVVCLSGAGGMMGETERIREGLASGGVNRAIETFEWSRGSVLDDQTGVEANRLKAGELARRVEDYLRRYPDRPVHLIGVSAGTGLVVWALEALDPGDQATGAILISSSLDTKYDLTSALGHLTDRLYSFNSVADTVLSLGVTWAGTVDRNGGLAGGLVGFTPQDNADAKSLYKEKLVQISWWPGDMVLGHLGDHLGATSPGYVSAKIAPLVLGKSPPKGPPDDQALTNEPKTKAYAEYLEKKRKAEEARKAADAEEARKAREADEKKTPAPEPAKEKPAPDSANPPKAPAGKSEGKQRFRNWQVEADGDAPPISRSEDLARFLNDTRRLP